MIPRARSLVHGSISATLVGLALSLGAGHPADAAEPRHAAAPTYAEHIRPILADACFNCHGFDAAERKADLRLDTSEGAYADNGGVRAIVPGDLQASEVWHRIRSTDPTEQMPPPEFPHQLSAKQIDLLGQWIEAGAIYEDHWAFTPPARPPVPEIPAPDGAQSQPHVVDAFVKQRLAREGVEPLPRADRRSQLRRLTLALTGLPPAPEDVEAFANAADEDQAWLQWVDRLLESPRHAEHMARHWLDAARYADTHGYQYDLSRHQWPWRDWVIRAFRDNMPFDQFTLEQMAGDLLPDPTDDQVLATAFNRNHPITIEGGIIDEEYRTEYVIDRVATVGTVWLGLSMECARCHDHKFDPISAEDFYSFYAYFNRVPERGHGGQNRFAPTRELESPLVGELLAGVRDELATVKQKLLSHREGIGGSRAAWERDLLAEAGNWQLSTPDHVSTAGSEWQPREDGSLLFDGPRPDRDHYELVLPARGPVAALRLEALTDDSLPAGSVGRADNGNFVLTRIKAWALAADSEPDQRRELAFESASASYQQSGYPVTDALRDNDRGGWAVDGNNRAESSTAEFVFEQPLPEGIGADEDWQLVVRLEFGWGAGHAIGRPRLSLADRAPGSLPADVAAALQLAPEERSAEQAAAVDMALLKRHGDAESAGLFDRLQALEQQVEALAQERPAVMIMQDMDQPPATYVLRAGLYDQPDKDRPVTARPLSAFDVKGADELPADRLGLAQWLLAPDNPLTSRVLVNRLWQQLFGTGLVATSEDLGTQGELPSHPELIDWLAVEMMESGWDIRAMLRLLVTSETFRRSTHAAPEAYAADPDNRLLARGPRQRLDAEAIRDNALAIAGLLEDTIGGPSVYPYHPEGLWEEVNNRPGFMETYEQSRGPGLYRRSMYTFWKRAVAPPAMQIFDAPNRETCVVRRSRTNTPLQALVLLHEPGQVEAARALAERMLLEGGDTLEQRVGHGFALALGRPPAGEELSVMRELLATETARFQQQPETAAALLQVGESRSNPDLATVELAAHTTLARLILNLDETITRP